MQTDNTPIFAHQIPLDDSELNPNQQMLRRIARRLCHEVSNMLEDTWTKLTDQTGVVTSAQVVQSVERSRVYVSSSSYLEFFT